MKNRFIQSIHIDWNMIAEYSYLRDIEALIHLTELHFQNNITFFVGENGTGKSTLLEGIAAAYGFNPEGGTRNYQFSTYEEISELGKAIRLTKGFKRPCGSYFFRAESFFNVATKAVEYESQYGIRGLHEQSHGESFLSFFQTFQGEGLYLMDEPEAALSPQRQLTLFIQIAKMAEQGSQFLIATHSPILLGIPGAEILSFDEGELCLCSYEETQSYQVMEMFINYRDTFISHLLEE
ncbi:MAG: AAA family ATPase [Clostridiales bacterium]|nr:AAA family ATPase [Clostridiales bacterium]